MRERSSAAILAALGAILAGAIPGCSDDTAQPRDGGADDAALEDAGADADSPAEAEAEAGADDAAATGTLTVLVQTFAWAEAPAAQEGATVALDAPGGARVEQTTGADGRTTFEGLDWSAGTASVTAYYADHAMRSIVGLTEPTGDVVVPLRALAVPDGIEVTGTAQNMIDETDSLTVSASTAFDSSQEVGPDWTLHVPADTAFTVVAAEWHGLPAGTVSTRGVAQEFVAWAVADHAGISAPATVDLDFAAGETPTAVHGSIPIPARADSPFRIGGTGYFYAFGDPNLWEPYLGFPTILDLSSDGNVYVYDGVYVAPAGFPDAATVYRLFGGHGEYAEVEVAGLPADGAQDIAFLDAPRITAPTSFTAAYPMHDAITWELFDDGVYPLLRIINDELIVWRISAPQDATTLTIPEPASTADLPALLGTGVVQASLLISESATPELTGHLGRDTAARTFILQP